jgi:predicted phosphodiesterase
MKVLVTADWHISGTRPRCRADEDWIATQAKDIEAVWKIAKDQRVEAVWILGDLFDTSRVATEAVNLVLREFEKAPCPVYTLCGNHDLPYHSFDLLERSSIGTVLHKFQMLATDTSTGVAAYPFGKEPEYGALSDYMKVNGLHTWITHQLTFPDEASRPIAGIGVLAQELLDACPAASVILTGDYHHGNIYTAPDGRRVITPGCLNISDADMKDYQPLVYIFDTFDLSAERVDLPIQGKVETAYLEHEHALEDMKEKFIASLETGAIKMKSFSEALEEVMPTLSPGVRKVLDEVKESLVPA